MLATLLGLGVLREVRRAAVDRGSSADASRNGMLSFRGSVDVHRFGEPRGSAGVAAVATRREGREEMALFRSALGVPGRSPGNAGGHIDPRRDSIELEKCPSSTGTSDADSGQAGDSPEAALAVAGSIPAARAQLVQVTPVVRLRTRVATSLIRLPRRIVVGRRIAGARKWTPVDRDEGFGDSPPTPPAAFAKGQGAT